MSQSGRGLLNVRLGLPVGLLGPSDIDGGGSSATGLFGIALPSVPFGSQPQWRNEGPDLAAVGDLPCDGIFDGCQLGGSYGTTAGYRISGRNLCTHCAVKMLEVEGKPGAEQIRTLRPFSLPGR